MQPSVVLALALLAGSSLAMPVVNDGGAPSASSTGSSWNPIERIIEMLSGIETKISSEQQIDEKMHESYASWCSSEVKNLESEVKMLQMSSDSASFEGWSAAIDVGDGDGQEYGDEDGDEDGDGDGDGDGDDGTDSDGDVEDPLDTDKAGADGDAESAAPMQMLAHEHLSNTTSENLGVQTNASNSLRQPGLSVGARLKVLMQQQAARSKRETQTKARKSGMGHRLYEAAQAQFTKWLDAAVSAITESDDSVDEGGEGIGGSQVILA